MDGGKLGPPLPYNICITFSFPNLPLPPLHFSNYHQNTLLFFQLIGYLEHVSSKSLRGLFTIREEEEEEIC